MNKVIKMPSKNQSRFVFQKTIKSTAYVCGIGLHTGKDIRLNIIPAEANTGVTFIRTDLEDGKNEIKATYDNVVDTRMCTVIANDFGASVGTVEHLMAAISACNIDNLIIEIDGPEVPVMDGSSDYFVMLFEKTGYSIANAKKRAIKILKEIKLEEGDKAISLKPSEEAELSYYLDYSNSKTIGQQSYSFNLSKEEFKNNVSSARTFGFLKDVEMLKQMGLALGGSLKNAIVIDENDQILNEDGLRFENEFARHKTLDAVGDLYLAGVRIIGSFTGIKSGHDLNNKLLRAMFADKTAWKFVDLIESGKAKSENEVLIKAI